MLIVEETLGYVSTEVCVVGCNDTIDDGNRFGVGVREYIGVGVGVGVS